MRNQQNNASESPDLTASIPIESLEKKTATYQPLVVIAVLLIFGVVIDYFFSLPPACSLPLLLFSLFGAIISQFIRKRDTFSHLAWRHNVLSGCLLASAVFWSGCLWHHLWWNVYPSDAIGNIVSEQRGPIALQGVISSAPRFFPGEDTADPLNPFGRAESRTIFDFRAQQWRDGANWVPVSGKMSLAISGDWRHLEPGDRLAVFDKVMKPSQAANPGDFDYANYCRTRRIRSLLVAQNVTVLEKNVGYSFTRLVCRVRKKGLAILAKYIGKENPTGEELAAAVLLGSRERIDQERMLPFIRTGSVHLLAISGLHIGLVAAFFFSMIFRLRRTRNVAIILLVVGLLFYMFITGARPPIVRATVLLVVASVALLLRRQALSWNTLALAAIVILVCNPTQTYQPGAMLSFLAVATFICCGDAQAYLQKLSAARKELDAEGEKKKRQEKEADHLPSLAASFCKELLKILLRLAKRMGYFFLISVAVVVVAMPLVMSTFNVVSFSGLVLNLLLWPLICAALLMGYLMFVFAMFCEPLANVAGAGCGYLLNLIEWTTLWGESWRISYLNTPELPTWWLLIFYGAIFFFIWKRDLGLARYFESRGRTCIAIGFISTWLLVGVVYYASVIWFRPPLRCTFLSVGHGVAVLVELPDNRNILCDVGHRGYPRRVGETVLNLLRSKQITHLDAVILSHTDTDHCNGLPTLLEKVSVGRLLVPPQFFSPDEEGISGAEKAAIAKLHEAVKSNNVPVQEVGAGDLLLANDADSKHPFTVKALSPRKERLYAGRDHENINSLVVLVEVAGASEGKTSRVLFAGDIAPLKNNADFGLTSLMQEPIQPVDVLVAPHHGIEMNNPKALYDWCRPQGVVISWKYDGRNSGPLTTAQNYEAWGARVWVTGEVGAVVFHSSESSSGLRCATAVGKSNQADRE